MAEGRLTEQDAETMTRHLLRAAIAVLAIAASPVGSAEPSGAPSADMAIRIEIRTPAPPPPEAVQAAIRAIEGEPRGEGRNFKVIVRVTAEPEKGSVARIDVGGYTIPTGRIPDAVRGASPPLAGADVAVHVTRAPYPGDLASLVGPWVIIEPTEGEAGAR
jgi:hypothetical protein